MWALGLGRYLIFFFYPSAVYGCAVTGHELHTGVGVTGHVRITTHPSVVLRENDERWKGVGSYYVCSHSGMTLVSSSRCGHVTR